MFGDQGQKRLEGGEPAPKLTSGEAIIKLLICFTRVQLSPAGRHHFILCAAGSCI